MLSRRTTIMLLVPGRNAISFDAPRIPAAAVIAALLLPLCSGAAAERCFRSLRSSGSGVAIASLSRVQLPAGDRVRAPARSTEAPRDRARPASVPEVQPPFGPPAPPAARPYQAPLRAAAMIVPVPDALVPSMTFAATVPLEVANKAVVSAKDVLRAFAISRSGAPSDSEIERVPANGTLRLQALHLDEAIEVRPFDEQFQPDPAALRQINHLLRCRVTGNEVEIDPRLIRVLVQLSGLYGKTIQLVSGHRMPRTLSTKPTSQHAIGRAADIRIPGVSINDLKRVAIKFGARGVGLYPEKGFVHVDVREKKYYWRYSAADGELGDMGMTRPAHALAKQREGAAAPDSEEESEAGDEAGGEPAAQSEGNHEHQTGATAAAEPNLEAEHGGE